MTTKDKITTTKSRILLIIVVSLMTGQLMAQQKSDTLIVNVGKSKIIFLIKDKADLEKMKNHDLNKVLEQLSLKLNADSSALVNASNNVVGDTTILVPKEDADIVVNKDENNDDNQWRSRDNDDNWRDRDDRDGRKYEKRDRRTHNFLNMDLGTNNYLMNDEFPTGPMAVRPWGSWYVALASVHQTPITGPLYLEWSMSVSWYNFKFEDDNTRVIDGDVVQFINDENPDLNYSKSKLTASYINASLVPIFRFGRARYKKIRINLSSSDGSSYIRSKSRGLGNFRIGAGPYVGYRLGSHTKVKFKEDQNGDRKKDKERDSFNLNNLRYGIRAQIGWRGTDIFVNYDVNELFQEGKGPRLNAFSFGFIL